MNILKITDKSLITNADLQFSKNLGLPVEVYCSKNKKTVAFGQIQDFNNEQIQISGVTFRRENYLFFGNRHESA
ncbi:hypothetical protein [Alkalihalobacillus trypoxylicola]|uniref:Uncharacterized protein n=1 Tax=Alkalihalobacillus trypoxylicola TaxID=519424 RepID=A0A161Q7Z1_9BACI|nr:hypothetical protein [Alkalihalobacillus trypoxylicola]KYG33136.1 hypothetical protein AZF04_17475 [Alkalihalobacillus trypoxylicola]GAF65334.1 hypothetical protein BTS2_2232 [Bacillus sp. TS-2]